MGWFDGRWGRSPEQRRLRALADAPEGALRDYLATPPPPRDTAVDDLRLLAVDVETTGLEPGTHRLLSIGFVPVNGREIELGGARHLLIRQGAGSVGESAIIHGLTDDALDAGMSLREALDATFAALRGRVLLAHHTDMEEGFLGAAAREVYGVVPPFSSVDTMHLQWLLLTRGFDDDPPRSALRLWGARQRYGLPVYKAHEALTDALACAELYLALLEEPGTGSTLKSLQR